MSPSSTGFTGSGLAVIVTSIAFLLWPRYPRDGQSKALACRVRLPDGLSLFTVIDPRTPGPGGFLRTLARAPD